MILKLHVQKEDYILLNALPIISYAVYEETRLQWYFPAYTFLYPLQTDILVFL